MATIAIRKPLAAGTVSGNQPNILVREAAAAAVLQGGDLLVDSAGKAAKSATPATAAKDKLGLAIHDVKEGTPWSLGAGATGGDFGGTFGGDFMGLSDLLKSVEGIGAHIVSADPDNLFEISLLGVFAITQIGATVGMVEDASGFWVADDAQANSVATVVGFLGGPDKGVVGDTQARVIARFLNSVYLLGL